MRGDFPSSLKELLRELERLPGIGPKSAGRIVMFLLHHREEMDRLVRALQSVRDNLRLCRRCFNFSESDLCAICQDEDRDPSVLCVVEDPMDIAVIEGTGFRGRYHVLHGVIAPTEGIGPDDLRIAELVQRVRTDNITEVILALSPTTEGEATTTYLAKLLKPMGVKVTQLAMGLPVGGALDYADPLTVLRALEARREV
ncbi:Recombination protein RecR [bacterium HR17]|jgi:recombination protein RecR|uniref:Recombination protein RecR n=1 Tax=Candidatus Fervidibacter japonicus TaxID=2035412 RepID=A0A2H5X8Z5_9BACT|nr:Recombination protein RecR [bacterium HR17]